MSRRILFVSADGLYPEALGGTEIRGRELADRLARSHDVALLTLSEWSAVDTPARRVPLHPDCLPATNWIRHHWSWAAGTLAQTLVLRRRIRALAARWRPDLVYFNKIGTLPALVVHELYAVGADSVVWVGDCHAATLRSLIDGTWRGALGRELGIFERFLREPRDLACRDRLSVVFNCEFLRGFYRAFDNRPSSSRVLPDGIDTGLFRPAEKPVSAPRFVFLARATGNKGYLEFCHAMASLSHSLVSGIDIMGDGPDLERGLEIIRGSGKSALIGWSGPVARNEIPERLRASSILVFPSREEGIPYAVLEALASGLGVVASSVGGIPEVVRDGETGLLVEPGNVDALAAACRVLAEREELRCRMGRQGRDVIIREHELQTCLARTVDHIESLFDATAAGARVFDYSRSAISNSR
jgi:glycosyltransferase involved in cell wall biosynthesis